MRGWKVMGLAALTAATMVAIVAPAKATASRLTDGSRNTTAVPGDRLSAITCPSANECWAVGSHYPSDHKSVIEQYNGSAWHAVSSPSTNAAVGNLVSITCSSTTTCWAVGFRGNAFEKTLIERYDGTAWTIVRSPNVATTANNSLDAVT